MYDVYQEELELLEATFPAELETQLHSMSVEALMNIDD